MTNDALMPFLAWIGVVVWLSAFGLAIAQRFRPAAALTGMLALPFLVPSLFVLVRWASDPVAYVTQYGAAALTELRLTAAIAALAMLVLTAATAAYRGRVGWGVFAWLIDGAGVAFLLYLVYFFRIFQCARTRASAPRWRLSNQPAACSSSACGDAVENSITPSSIDP